MEIKWNKGYKITMTMNIDINEIRTTIKWKESKLRIEIKTKDHIQIE